MKQVLDRYDKKLAITHNIKQLGFRAVLFGSRFSIFVDEQQHSPKTQPFHIVNRYGQA